MVRSDAAAVKPDAAAIAGPVHAAQRPHAERNLLLLAAYQIALRCGWIFKTESIIMPIVLDLLGGGAMTRSVLPLVNRLGQSLPPLMLAGRIKALPLKKLALAASALVMALCFAGLSGIWIAGPWMGDRWLQWLFLSVYGVFFTSVGIQQISFSTLQGKLVATTRRGRLLLITNVAGSVLAITCVMLFLPALLQGGRFEWIFALSALLFAVAAAIALLLRESRDECQPSRRPAGRLWDDALRTLRQDRRFLRLAILAALFSSSGILFPHYQALGRGARLAVPTSDILWWIVLQNAGTGLSSMVVGPLADRRGYRAVLRLLLPAVGAAPLLALVLAAAGPAGRVAFPLVFVLVGLTPVLLRTLFNYTLELAEAEEHPRYLSTLNLCMALPILFSPLAGWLIDLYGFDAVFVTLAALVAAAWLMTFGLDEPRHRALPRTSGR